MRMLLLCALLPAACSSDDDGRRVDDCETSYTPTGMAYRDEIAGYRTIHGDVTLLEVSDPTQLSCLERVIGDLMLIGADGAKGLPNLNWVGGSITFIDEPESPATEIIGLPALMSVVGGVVIEDFAALRDISGMNALQTVGGYPGITIANNPELLFISGFDGLTDVAETISVKANAKLQRIDGLQVKRAGRVVLAQNPALESVAGFARLARLGSLILSDTKLTQLDFLGGLEQTAETPALGLSLRDNRNLLSIKGIGSVTRLARLEIWRNPALSDIQALMGVTAYASTGVTISDNRSLSSCQATGVADHLQAMASGEGTWHASLSGNAPCP